ncbi:helix-turn-helix domain-containing protein [Vibrio harveyi]|uniref:helix-turn-helix domain-containing protein n=1 Tax=Vibrio harveyi TaxID=669 RepID=UPI000681D45F|nr:helix-turn-helix domain-containing protein [Vibrio harveyi]ELV8773603.1 AraC family transcriptional regulator [Vibrio harveyi]PNM42794.1 AraC family transcriptional regulator [Vibrio harveyi]
MNKPNEIIGKLKLQGEDSSVSIILKDIVYLSNISGNLSFRALSSIMDNPIVVVYSPSNILGSDVGSGEVREFRKGILVYHGNLDLVLGASSHLVVISQSFFRELGMPEFPVGVIQHVHESIIFSLMNSVSKSGKPEYEIMALANIIGVDNYKAEVNLNYKKIVDCIERYGLNCDFNLEFLCSCAHMSRRKAQYIISEHETTFLELLHNFRVRKLKDLLKNESSTAHSVLVERVGFKNISSANRIFQKITGMRMREYLSSLSLKK